MLRGHYYDTMTLSGLINFWLDVIAGECVPKDLPEAVRAIGCVIEEFLHWLAERNGALAPNRPHGGGADSIKTKQLQSEDLNGSLKNRPADCWSLTMSEESSYQTSLTGTCRWGHPKTCLRDWCVYQCMWLTTCFWPNEMATFQSGSRHSYTICLSSCLLLWLPVHCLPAYFTLTHHQPICLSVYRLAYLPPSLSNYNSDLSTIYRLVHVNSSICVSTCLFMCLLARLPTRHLPACLPTSQYPFACPLS